MKRNNWNVIFKCFWLWVVAKIKMVQSHNEFMDNFCCCWRDDWTFKYVQINYIKYLFDDIAKFLFEFYRENTQEIALIASIRVTDEKWWKMIKKYQNVIIFLQTRKRSKKLNDNICATERQCHFLLKWW